jgi:hypothetical protein
MPVESEPQANLPQAKPVGGNAPRYWFPAKTYGWGWGPPATWEGWLVLAAFVATVVAISFLVTPGRNMAAFQACIWTAAGALIAICWLTGEPPRWRWGK